MPVSTAQALVPGLVIVPADPEADAESLAQLAVWVMQRISPLVSPDPPDGIVLDTTGANHLHGGEAAMLEALVGRLPMSGVMARAAIADSWEPPMHWHVMPPIRCSSPCPAQQCACWFPYRSRPCVCRPPRSPACIPRALPASAA